MVQQDFASDTQAVPEPGEPVELEQPLRIRTVGAEALDARYTNLLNVAFDKASFQLTFSQFLQPLISTPDDAKALASQGYIPAQAVARLIFTPLMMEETIELLQKQLAAYRAQHGRPDAPRVPGDDDDE